MLTWLVYIPPAKNLDQRITLALADYDHRFHRRPTCLQVHRTLTEQARALATCAGIEVIGNGGTLANEVWLPRPDEETEPQQERLL